jgi:hypothetical protein
MGISRYFIYLLLIGWVYRYTIYLTISKTSPATLYKKKLVSAAPLGLKCGTHKSVYLDEIRMLSESAVYEKNFFS